MPYFRTPLLYFCIGFLCAFSRLAVAELVPPPKGEAEILGRLVGFQRAFSTVLSQSLVFDVDLFTLYREYGEMVSFLNEDPAFRAAWYRRNRNTFWDIQSQPKDPDTQITIRSLSPQIYESIKADIAAAIQNIPAGIEPQDWIRGLPLRMEAAKKQNEKKRADPLHILLGAVPKELKPAVIGNAKDGKLAERVIGFWKEHSLEIPEKGKQDFATAITEIENSLVSAKDETIVEKPAEINRDKESLLLAYLASHPEIKTWQDLSEAIAADTEENLQNIFDIRDYVLPRVKSQLDHPEIPAKLQQDLGRYFSELKKEHGYIDQAIRPEFVRMVEMGPEGGMLRGMIPSNCASQTSAYTSLDPHERIFYLLDKEGAPIGYFQSTITEVDGKRVLYISSAEGRDLTPGQLISAIEALRARKHKFGVQAVMVPESTAAQGLVNRPALQAVFDAYRKLGSKKTIGFLDPEIRKKITEKYFTHNHSSYDGAENHEVGFLLSDRALGEGGKWSVDFTGFTESSLPVVPVREMSNGEIAKLAVTLAAGEHGKSLKSLKSILVIGRTNFNFGLVERFIAAAQNSGNENISTYLSTMQQFLNALPVNADDKDEIAAIGERALYFSGVCKSPDAFAPENIEETLHRFSEPIKLAILEGKNEVIEKALASNPKAFLNNPAIGNLLRLLIKDFSSPRSTHRGEKLFRALGLTEQDPKLAREYVEAVVSELQSNRKKTSTVPRAVAQIEESIADLMDANAKLDVFFDPKLVKVLKQSMGSEGEGHAWRALATLIVRHPDGKDLLDAEVLSFFKKESVSRGKVRNTLGAIFSAHPEHPDLVSWFSDSLEHSDDLALSVLESAFEAYSQKHALSEAWKLKLLEILQKAPGSTRADAALQILSKAMESGKTQPDLLTPELFELAMSHLEFEKVPSQWTVDTVADFIRVAIDKHPELEYLVEERWTSKLLTPQYLYSSYINQVVPLLNSAFKKHPNHPYLRTIVQNLLQSKRGEQKSVNQEDLILRKRAADILAQAFQANPQEASLLDSKFIAAVQELAFFDANRVDPKYKAKVESVLGAMIAVHPSDERVVKLLAKMTEKPGLPVSRRAIAAIGQAVLLHPEKKDAFLRFLPLIKQEMESEGFQSVSGSALEAFLVTYPDQPEVRELVLHLMTEEPGMLRAQAAVKAWTAAVTAHPTEKSLFNKKFRKALEIIQNKDSQERNSPKRKALQVLFETHYEEPVIQDLIFRLCTGGNAGALGDQMRQLVVNTFAAHPNSKSLHDAIRKRTSKEWTALEYWEVEALQEILKEKPLDPEAKGLSPEAKGLSPESKRLAPEAKALVLELLAQPETSRACKWVLRSLGKQWDNGLNPDLIDDAFIDRLVELDTLNPRLLKSYILDVVRGALASKPEVVIPRLFSKRRKHWIEAAMGTHGKARDQVRDFLASYEGRQILRNDAKTKNPLSITSEILKEREAFAVEETAEVRSSGVWAKRRRGTNRCLDAWEILSRER